jgi:SecD/SecF fusion protein
MQNKGLIKLFAILFGLVSLYQLSFTYFSNNIENNAEKYAFDRKASGESKSVLEKFYLDSVANKPVVNMLFAKFTYNEAKERSLNLGLDLKGGINAILQVSVEEILNKLSNNSTNPVFKEALEKTAEKQKNTDDTFLETFFKTFKEISNGSVKLGDPTIFGNKALSDRINFKMTDEEVRPIIEEEITGSINTAFQVIRSRIDKFGVTQPNIQRIGNSGRILIELPGAKNIERVERLLQSTAELEFWELNTNQEVASFFLQANSVVEKYLKEQEETTISENEASKEEDELRDLLGDAADSIAAPERNNLFSVFQFNPFQQSSIIGSAKVLDTVKVNKYLKMRKVNALLSREMRYTKFLWDAKSFTVTRSDNEEVEERINLYAIKSNRNNEAPIQGNVIRDASQEYGQTGAPEISMTMNSVGTKKWAKMTSENIGKFVGIVLDDKVYTAPVVNDAINTGRTSISGGNMTVAEAQDVSTVLKAGKLPSSAHIIQSEIVGPSLGQKAIDTSFRSFVLALILVLIWMIFYYGRAGFYADTALVVNILLIFGVLSSFGAVLTLPGIAGIILTIGMSVDANVIIFERIKEGIRNGANVKAAIAHGFSFKGALSAIIDANITTMLTGIILYVFGTGPVKGFAYTLMLGIITSLFTAVFITRILVEKFASKNQTFTFSTGITKNWFQNINVQFIQKRKIAYIVSSIFIVIGIGSLFTNGLNYGVDFVGGRNYIVKFDKEVESSQVANTLKEVFGSTPEVKSYGGTSQLKISTKYKIEEEGNYIDNEVQSLLFEGLQPYLPSGMTEAQFKVDYEGERSAGIQSKIKVEPTIADDIKRAAGWAILGSLIVVFLYLYSRFKKPQYSLGAVAAVFHDVLIVLSIFSLFWKVMPFDMEIGQSFIAALLTVVGYSINDTVVIFDRIREFSAKFGPNGLDTTINKALSSTLGRTINTSLTTLVVLLAIFLFGGDSIKGFMFALIIGVVVGTYSSLFIASPLLYDTLKKENKDKKE